MTKPIIWPTTVWLLILTYILTFSLLATREHLAHETGALDLGNYDQAMWNASQGRGLRLTTLPTLSLNRLGLHVEPTLFLFVPLYWLWPNPIILLWVQTIALGLAAWPLYLLALHRLQFSLQPLAKGSACLIVLTYLLLPATEAVNLFDFHAVALSPCFMLTALYFLNQGLSQQGGNLWSAKHHQPSTVNQSSSKAYALAALFFILAMGTKEDIPLHVFMIGLYLIVWLRQWRVGLPIAFAGGIWAFIAFGLVIPAFRVSGQQSAYVDYFPTLGQTPFDIALSPFTKPDAVIELIFRPANIAAIGMLTLPFAFIGLFGLPFLILATPSLAISLLSNNPLQQELETWHYAAPMLPFITLAVVDGLARLSTWLGRGKVGRVKHLILLTTLLLASLSYHVLRGYSPLAWPFHWPEVTNHHHLGQRIAATIPPEASVVAQAELVPLVSQREQVRIWTGPYDEQDDIVFVDLSHPNFVNTDHAQVELLSRLIYHKNFGVVTMQDGYLVLQQNAARRVLEPTLQSFLFAETDWADESTLAQFGDFARLVRVKAHTYRSQEPQVTLYLHTLQRPAAEYFLHLYLLNQAGEILGATVFKQPAMIWWPPQMWAEGSVIKIRFNTLPWWTGDGHTNHFSYAFAISTVEDPWQVEARLPARGLQARPDHLVHIQKFRRLAGMVYAGSAAYLMNTSFGKKPKVAEFSSAKRITSFNNGE